jgi:hypothetical protein
MSKSMNFCVCVCVKGSIIKHKRARRAALDAGWSGVAIKSEKVLWEREFCSWRRKMMQGMAVKRSAMCGG